MDEQAAVPSLHKRWTALRSDFLFLPKLDQMRVERQTYELEAVEFVRVAPVDESVQVPSAPAVATADVRSFPGWLEEEAEQQRMWALVGTMIEGSKVTRTCPDCNGTRQVDCGRCHGMGWVNCPWCSGGYTSCGSCGGSGGHTTTRTTTDASGRTSTSTERETCMRCGGDGRDRCIHCMGMGRESCSTCSGGGEVVCETCSPAGTVDIFVRRSFVEQLVATHILPVHLTGYPEGVRLPQGCVQLGARHARTPSDAEADRPVLAERSIALPDARLFFVRQATAELHTVSDERTGSVSVTFIDGEPEPVLTVHRLVQDTTWTPERERYKAFGASVLYVLAPVLLASLIYNGQALVGAGAGVAALAGALLLNRRPLRAFRLAFLDLRCAVHHQVATVTCPGCGKHLCHDCLIDLVRCPFCGRVPSEAITHLIEDGRWVPAPGS